MIDTIEAILTRTIAMGGHPYAIAAGGARVYVTDYPFYGGQSTHSLSVIHTAGGVVVETLPVGGNSIAVGEGGVEIYVVSHCRDGQFTSTLSTIDTITGGVTGVLINGMPDALAAHEDRIYLTDPWHSSVLQVSARSASVIDTDAANHPPKLTITRIDGDDETVVFEPTISDPDGDDVTCTATQPFSGSVTDLGGGRFRYTPNGRAAQGFVDHFAITADDGHGGVVTKTVAVAVV